MGDVAPDFALRDQHGRAITISEHRGRPVVVVFFPFAFSRVCSGELADLGRDWAQLLGTSADTAGDDPVRTGNPSGARGAVLLAVSCDPMFSLRAFADAQEVRFALLSDFWPHGAVSRLYGVFDSEGGFSRRSTFIVDRDGTVAWALHAELPDARNFRTYGEVFSRLAT